MVIPLYSETDSVCCNTVSNAAEESLSVDDFIEAHDEDGNPITLQVVRYFFYNADEYVVLSEAHKTDSAVQPGEEQDNYIMKVNVEIEDGEEIEVYSPIEDNDLYDSLVQIAFSKHSVG